MYVGVEIMPTVIGVGFRAPPPRNSSRLPRMGRQNQILPRNFVSYDGYLFRQPFQPNDSNRCVLIMYL